jgi:F0F1-type ATP synthase assembly protein I
MRIFRDPGFLITLLLIGLLAAVGAYILVRTSNEYGIPLQEYWR